MSKDSITVDGTEYVRADRVQAVSRDGLEYVICRTYSAGVFAGYLKERDGKEAVLLDARRIWYWDGAASLSQLAVQGTSKPNKCKFPCEVPQVIVTEVVEILPVSEAARKSIAEVPVWEN